MSRADELKAQAARSRRTRPEADEPAPAPPPRPARTDPFRQTFDLSPERHEQLRMWKLETSMRAGRDVSVQKILAAMVEVLLEDEQVARRVRRRLEQG